MREKEDARRRGIVRRNCANGLAGVNAIRVYNLDPDLNHDLCASIFNGVGIYMLYVFRCPAEGGKIED